MNSGDCDPTQEGVDKETSESGKLDRLKRLKSAKLDRRRRERERARRAQARRNLKALNKRICSENRELNALTLAQARPSMLLH